MSHRVILYLAISALFAFTPLLGGQSVGSDAAQVQVEVLPAVQLSLEPVKNPSVAAGNVSLDLYLHGSEEFLIEIQDDNGQFRKVLSVNDRYTLPFVISESDDVIIEMSYVKY